MGIYIDMLVLFLFPHDCVTFQTCVCTLRIIQKFCWHNWRLKFILDLVAKSAILCEGGHIGLQALIRGTGTMVWQRVHRLVATTGAAEKKSWTMGLKRPRKDCNT